VRTHVKVRIPTDADGFTSQECPACRRRFKVVFSAQGGHPLAYCPYCGHHGHQCWWTSDQVKYFQGVVAERVVAPAMEKLARDLRRLNRPGSLVEFDLRVDRPRAPWVPREPATSMQLAVFPCCGERVKHDGRSERLHCPVCGDPIVIG